MNETLIQVLAWVAGGMFGAIIVQEQEHEIDLSVAPDISVPRDFGRSADRLALRGPVNNAEEKRLIGEIANRIAQAGKVASRHPPGWQQSQAHRPPGLATAPARQPA